MRYFFISYYHSSVLNRTQGYGYVSFSSSTYPSINTLKENLDDKESHFVFLNIIELTEDDFKSFNDKPEGNIDGFSLWKSEILGVMNTKFNFSNEMILNSIEVFEKKGMTLIDLYNENKTIEDAVFSIWNIKLQ